MVWSQTQYFLFLGNGCAAACVAGARLKSGQGVIVPSFTFAASAEVMPVMGAIPVFADVDPVTFNIDPTQLDGACAAARDADVEIVGIIGVGLFGQPPITRH